MTEQPSALDPASALAALRESEASTRKATDPNPSALYVLWGSVYAFGYLVMHASLFGWWAVELSVALTIFAGLIVAAAAVSAVLGVRAGGDVRGASTRRGMFYGLTWAAGLFSVGFIIVALLRLELAATTTVWLSSAVVTVLVGVLFAAGGALFVDRAMFAQGLALLAANLLAVLIGPGPFVLIGWLAACAVLFAGAAVAARKDRSVRR